MSINRLASPSMGSNWRPTFHASLVRDRHVNEEYQL